MLLFRGPVIPFGAKVAYKPINSKCEARLHQHDAKMHLAIFMGQHLNAGGGGTGDLLVADLDDIQNCDSISHIHMKRFKSPEAVVHMDLGNHHFCLQRLLFGTIGTNTFSTSSQA